MKLFKQITVVTILVLATASCNDTKTEKTSTASYETEAPLPLDVSLQEKDQFGYKKGQKVPNDEVCMVNDAFMGKKQIEVPLDGKMYYGCCTMCKERLPKDENVRYGIDPLTGEKVDKADAYIVLVGNNGEVAYFASSTHFEKFLASNIF